jgi:hypothetical protein
MEGGGWIMEGGGWVMEDGGENDGEEYFQSNIE